MVKRLSVLLCLVLAVYIPVSADEVTFNITQEITTPSAIQVTTPSSVQITSTTPSMIKVTVPLDGASFNINPNDVSNFVTSSDLVIHNESTESVVVNLESAHSTNDYQPKIVSPNTFDDWGNIGRHDTETKIALGLVDCDTNNEVWFGSEDDYYNINYSFILDQEQTKVLAPIAKAGLAWSESKTMSYDMTITVTMENMN